LKVLNKSWHSFASKGFPGNSPDFFGIEK